MQKNNNEINKLTFASPPSGRYCLIGNTNSTRLVLLVSELDKHIEVHTQIPDRIGMKKKTTKKQNKKEFQTLNAN